MSFRSVWKEFFLSNSFKYVSYEEKDWTISAAPFFSSENSQDKVLIVCQLISRWHWHYTHFGIYQFLRQVQKVLQPFIVHQYVKSLYNILLLCLISSFHPFFFFFKLHIKTVGKNGLTQVNCHPNSLRLAEQNDCSKGLQRNTNRTVPMG